MSDIPADKIPRYLLVTNVQSIMDAVIEKSHATDSILVIATTVAEAESLLNEYSFATILVSDDTEENSFSTTEIARALAATDADNLTRNSVTAFGMMSNHYDCFQPDLLTFREQFPNVDVIAGSIRLVLAAIWNNA